MTLSRRVGLGVFAGALLSGALAAPVGARKRRKRKKVRVCHNGQTIKVRKAAKPAHLRHGDVEGACPPPIDAGCPGPPDLSTSSFTTIRQFSQTFVSPRNGVLTAAACEVRLFPEGADFSLEIRRLDPLTGLPAAPVLASALLPNQPETDIDPITLRASFDPPARVEEGDGYALVVTMTGGTGDFSVLAATGAQCPGRLLVTDDAGEFSEIAADMVFSATIV